MECQQLSRESEKHMNTPNARDNDQRISPQSGAVTLIQPKRKLSPFELKELIEYRDLLYFLSLREIKLRYKQTNLGVVWVILQPLVPAIIFAILFGNFGRLPSNGQPYLLMVFTGIVAWGFLSNSVGRGSGSLVGNSNLLSKIYFPRIIIPLASISSVVVDGLVGVCAMLVLTLFFGIKPGAHLIAAPFFLIASLLMGLGITLLAASLNVYRRDIGHLVPFALQAWNYMTPVVYSSSLIPKKWLFLYSLNPTVGLIEGFRWSILGGEPATPLMLTSMTVGLVVSVVAGMAVFKNIERGFADII
jgi:lipopolysaccharide transport system permease protein